MKKQLFKISIVVIAAAAMLAGCATGNDTQASGPGNAVQSHTGPTVSGSVDVGGGKSFH